MLYRGLSVYYCSQKKPIKLRALQVQQLIYFVHKFYILALIIYFFQSMFMKKPLIFFHDIEKQNKTICFTFVTNNTIYQQTIIYYVVKSSLCSEIHLPIYLSNIYHYCKKYCTMINSFVIKLARSPFSSMYTCSIYIIEYVLKSNWHILPSLY